MAPHRALRRPTQLSAVLTGTDAHRSARFDHNGAVTRSSAESLQSAVGRPLVVRFAAFGDVVLLTPLLATLYRRYRQPADLLGSGAWTPELLAHDPHVAHIQMVASRKSPYLLCRSQRLAVRWLRQRAPGPVYLCEPDDKAQWLLDRAGIDRRRVLRAFDFQADQQIHFTDWWVSIAQRTPECWSNAPLASPAAHIDAHPRLFVTDADRRDCDDWLRTRNIKPGPLVLLQPGNKRTHKRGRLATPSDNKHWPLERWAKLMSWLLTKLPGVQLLICGSAAEAGVAGELGRRLSMRARVHNLAGDLPVRRLLALQERAHSMISVDTGPAHAAAALGCPLVVLFGREDQRVWRPRSRHDTVRVLGGERGRDSAVEDIAVDTVAEAWLTLLAASRSANVSGR